MGSTRNDLKIYSPLKTSNNNNSSNNFVGGGGQRSKDYFQQNVLNKKVKKEGSLNNDIAAYTFDTNNSIWAISKEIGGNLK